MSVTPSYGARQEDWTTLDLILGLTSDLLPVVSNPEAEVSPHSFLKAGNRGKVPSLYNRKHQVKGFIGWSKYRATSADVGSWMKERDYGICLQTRYVRAFDIDVEDREKALALAEGVERALGCSVPWRVRAGSGKRLGMVRVKLPEGQELKKRVLKVDGGMIELLGDGQQFIFAGTHTGGSRYEIAGGIESLEIPEVGIETLERAWERLAEEFEAAGSEKDKRAAGKISANPSGRWNPYNENNSEEVKGGTVVEEDPWVGALFDLGVVLQQGREGELYIRCPFEEEHTGGTGGAADGDTSTVYFVKGTRGYEQGHFKCLHAHCAERSDADFIDALGLYASAFEVLAPERHNIEVRKAGGTVNTDEAVGAGVGRMPLPRSELNLTASGMVKATLPNLIEVMSAPHVCGWRIRYDEFTDEVMVGNGGREAKALRDDDYTTMRATLERAGFMPVGREIMRDAVQNVAFSHPYDSAKEWLSGLRWDGVARCERFLIDYAGCEDTPYAKSVGSYMWTALAGRVLEPGIKADMVPVLVGAQGVRKSTSLEAIAPTPEYFAALSLAERNDDLSRRMRGKIVLELAELNGLRRKDMESVKSFIAQTHERWVPKYRECAVSYPRRALFVGTTNAHDFLTDITGNRRWLPIEVQEMRVEEIVRDRELLWAEAAALFTVGGVAWNEAIALGVDQHPRYQEEDRWHERVKAWLETPSAEGILPGTTEPIKYLDVVTYVLGSEERSVSDARVSAILRALGLTRRMYRKDGKQQRGWFVK